MKREMHEAEIKKVLDSYENGLKELKKKKWIVSGVGAGSLILTIILGTVGSGTISDYLFIATVISAIVCAVLVKKINENVKEFIKDSEIEFYDRVYAGMIADEIGGTHQSKNERKRKKEIDKYLGEILESRAEQYKGTLDGRTYSIEFSRGTVISEVTERDKKVIKYKTSEVFSGTDLTVKSGRIADNKIVLLGGFTTDSYAGRKNKVTMDKKGFPFEVHSDDRMAAYKFLTPAVMLKLEDFNAEYRIDKMIAQGNAFGISMQDEIINMHVNLKFGKNVDKLREKYTYEYMYSLSHVEAEKFRKLIMSVDPVTRVA